MSGVSSTKGAVAKILVLGGARSGKSDFALDRAEAASDERLFIATATAMDEEMAARIETHRLERGAGWETVEEPVDIARAVSESPNGAAVLIDCLTLWITNLIEAGLPDGEIIERAKALNSAIAKSEGTVVTVSNEVGAGIVPDNPLARRFRDLAGAVNRLAAAAATEVYLLTAGIPVKIK